MKSNEGWCRPMGRAGYALIGLILVLAKFQLDRWVLLLLWNVNWGPAVFLGMTDYLGGGEITDVPREEWLFTLGALALPFIAVGCWLTLRRLKDLAWSPLWVLLFFVPALNLIFFAVLCAVPGRPEGGQEKAGGDPAWLRWLPDSRLGVTMLSLFITIPVAVALIWLGADHMKYYGWGLFCGIPFAQGFISVQLAALRHPVGWGRAVLLASLGVLIIGLFLLGLALEGVICLVMAFPIGWVLAVIGALISAALQRSIWSARNKVNLSCVLLAALVTGMTVEPRLPRQATIAPVTTSVDIAAPPETVWKHVVIFSELDPPTELFFRLGIAYPKHAVIEGHGVGAVRHCVFSTGPFVEPITVWDEPNHLAFDVTKQPQPMIELSWVDELHTPHLDGYLRSVKGEFRLERLPNGGTRLQGTTWYANLIWPEAYWRLWSDRLIHDIHERVLNHIKKEAEQEG